MKCISLKWVRLVSSFQVRNFFCKALFRRVLSGVGLLLAYYPASISYSVEIVIIVTVCPSIWMYVDDTRYSSFFNEDVPNMARLISFCESCKVGNKSMPCFRHERFLWGWGFISHSSLESTSTEPFCIRQSQSLFEHIGSSYEVLRESLMYLLQSAQSRILRTIRGAPWFVKNR